jgi:hypothetical protein
VTDDPPAALGDEVNEALIGGLLGFLWVVRGAKAGVKGARRVVVTDP